MCLNCHVVTVEAEFKDLQAIRRACQRLGWQFLEGQKTYQWYGRWLGDYDAAHSAFRVLRPEEYGTCDHAIRVPGAAYEIGLVRRGDHFLPVWDFWGAGGLAHVLPDNGMAGFVQAYALERQKLQAAALGYAVHEAVEVDGTVQLTCVSYQE